MHESFDLRVILESAAAELTAARITDAELAELEAIVASESGTAPMAATLQRNASFHSLIARATGNERLVALIEKLLSEMPRLINGGLHQRGARGADLRVAPAKPTAGERCNAGSHSRGQAKSAGGRGAGLTPSIGASPRRGCPAARQGHTRPKMTRIVPTLLHAVPSGAIARRSKGWR